MRPIAVRARRRLGQNFLSDPSILTRIADAADISRHDTVLEIGPGTGLLTRQLARRAGRIVAVEIDERMRPDLDEVCRDHPNVQVVWGDFLKLRWEDLGLQEGSILPKVVANIPYYITTPILLELLQVRDLERKPMSEVAPRARAIVLTVQHEVAQRMRAVPGGKDYGSLSVAVQYAATLDYCFGIPRTAFIPRPKVDSAVVRLSPRTTPPVEIQDAKTFFRVVRGAFGQRRKTLMNALMGAAFDREVLSQALAGARIDPHRRGETLSLTEFAHLADQIAAVDDPSRP